MKKTRHLFKVLLLAIALHVSTALQAEGYQPSYSTAGFYALPKTGRTVYNMNPDWKLHKGVIVGAEQPRFDDSSWESVSLPNGIELLPSEASGGINYQGEVWYRKRFTPQANLKGKELSLHFEAIMGKSKIWVNGQLLKEHFGGFLPAIVDVTSHLRIGEENIITVWADNSDDPTYAPGTKQEMLDFVYFGGIYRDCWLIAHNSIFLTDPNFENEIAGGGLFVSYDQVSDQSADINLKAHVRNRLNRPFTGVIEYILEEKGGEERFLLHDKFTVLPGEATHITSKIGLDNPQLWSPDAPYLYNLKVQIRNNKGEIVDGYYRRIGVRSIEFKGSDGFWLNGKPYPHPLIGGNRHQDFAVIGNALSNSLHWRDAKKLRDAGMQVIRNAHYPQDPAFMDACDELGLFVIVNTPGWQFWNDAPIFAESVYSDIRNMVRRDRNHPSVWMWEPILNETWYPEIFAKKALETVNEEYPYPYCYSGCDAEARGHEHFPVLFSHPVNGAGGAFNAESLDPKVSYFTREWGDNVDDWSSHNSPSRVNRLWGEHAMLQQAAGYAKTDYQYTCYDALYRNPRQHVGGCLWHSFDHQRGYHPDPFYGGIMDAFRQPKLSYYLFTSQRPTSESELLLADQGPMVHIAHAMTPFSPKDVTVYSNCDEVRLQVFENGQSYTYHKETEAEGMPSPIITFKDAFNVMEDKSLARARKHTESYLLAEGIIDGKVVATHKVVPSRRATRLLLWVDDEAVQMEANGSDLVTVIAGIADANGTIKRLNSYEVHFEIEGNGTLVADRENFTNPRQVQWGTAPILVRSTTTPGKIKVRASVVHGGKHTPMAAELILTSVPSQLPLIERINK
ncbi:MAG: glycoside hydrolase family 2 TIM barrel-domain containing protein [Phocaeicola sp.]